jgi:ATP-dependent DNA helicase RecG
VLARRRAALAALDAQPRTGTTDGLLDRFDERLPFTLTRGQVEVSDQILGDLAAGHPMHRLLQGEVGSGKTVVALRAMLRVIDSGGQAALLAPTEVLAQQHHRSITAMLGELAAGGMLGGAEDGTQVALLTGSLGAAARKSAMLDAASGTAGIVVGTHALLEEKVQFADLGLVVVDEQHRFGVEQRAALTAKAGEVPPHVLVMTATPIPRTVAMTVFGDLETSTLTELPAGRAPIQSSVVPMLERPDWLERAWARIREEAEKGHQTYIVCPRIGGPAKSRLENEEADGDPEPDESASKKNGSDLAAVEEIAPTLAGGALHDLRVEALHGRMPADRKDEVMRAFAAGDVDVLVSTTVIEVGVDVANATAMVVLDADRFGVSQLHQLRGRVGRGGLPGLCLLVTRSEEDSVARARLQAVAATSDGFELSRVDLEQRREGDVLGSAQSGRRSGLKLLSVIEHEDVIAEAREAAGDFVAKDPDLSSQPDLASAVRRLDESEQGDYLEKA